MLAGRDTRMEASRLRRLSPLQPLEDQSPSWGIRCHSCTGREGLSPSWKLSYKTYVLRFTRESRFSFNQRIVRSRLSQTAPKETLLVKSQICRKQFRHTIFETQKDRNLAPVKRTLITVEITLQ